MVQVSYQRPFLCPRRVFTEKVVCTEQYAQATWLRALTGSVLALYPKTFFFACFHNQADR